MGGNKLTITSPIEFFIEVCLASPGIVPGCLRNHLLPICPQDASSSLSFREEVTGQSLVNLSSYLDKLTPELWSGSLYRIPHIELFLKKIKEHDTVSAFC